jgi:hypothetical protein
MGALSTLLAERVESLLPHTGVAACVPNSPYCSSDCDEIKGSCLWLHRQCHLSCHGKGVCGSWTTGRC